MPPGMPFIGLHSTPPALLFTFPHRGNSLNCRLYLLGLES